MLLSPELLRDAGDTPAELSDVSVRLNENLKQSNSHGCTASTAVDAHLFGLSDSPATLLLTYSDSELKKLISVKTKTVELVAAVTFSGIINHGCHGAFH